MTTDLILGTAGHIDHGKTTLIRVLTGVDTDRLPEEKKRGITIELGFAELELGEFRLGIVDVPGHERFVRNMLAGATGIDVALLVVAADDSVKPQTIEHLEILKLLNLQQGVIALTKCDVSQADWIDLVEEEVRELVDGTFLQNAPIIRTSAHTGAGLGELRAALTDAATSAASDRLSSGPFRLPIDRSFTIAGHGTVVTGSVTSGSAQVGDELVIEPGATKVRVRGIQNHDRQAEEIHRGQRAAINLAGIHHQKIGRGQELCSAGHLQPARLVTVQLHLLPIAGRPLRSRTRIRVHLGTAELLGSVVLLGRSELGPGESAPAQIFLSEPVVSTWGQPLVLRSESPVWTIGGGTILDPNAERIRSSETKKLARITDLASTDNKTRAIAAIYFTGLRPWRPEELARSAGVKLPQELIEELRADGELLELRVSPTRMLLVSRDALADIFDRFEQTLEKQHEQHPLRSLLDPSWLMNRFAYLGDDALLGVLLQQMEKQKRLKRGRNGISLPGKGPQLSKNERQLYETIIDRFRDAGHEPPTVKEVQSETRKNQAAVPQLVALAAADGFLVEINKDFFLHVDRETELRELITTGMAEHNGLTVSQIREILGTSRKYALPMCEYLDNIGFTRREGDLRVLVK
ncbi:MAG: selenocysteine-specific translation elongation factor [Pirellulales bacterium]|nr:selenocysteine-specific translation elongation factor [Pirellulales bacterium]